MKTNLYITFLLAVFALVVVSQANICPAQPAGVSHRAITPKKIKKAGIRDIDFRNRSYSFNQSDDDQKITLRNGEYNEDGGLIYYIKKNDVVYGDVNGDGVEDAVVRIRLTSGASLRDFEIQAYEFKDGEAKLLAQMDSGQAT